MSKTPATLLSALNVYKSYGTSPLFKDLSLNIQKDERLGLIGPNGAGKSTLLKILAKQDSVDTGELVHRADLRIAYLHQQDAFDEQLTIQEIIASHLPEYLPEWEIQKQLNDIQREFKFPDMTARAETLSGGWKKRLALASIVAQDADLVLLDEPTNHLDLQGIIWLEYFLKEAKFSFILISHDRTILENSCNHILDLDPRYKQGYLKVRGNYSRFLEERERTLLEQQQEQVTLANKLRTEIEWLRRGPKARTTKAQYRIDQAHELMDEVGELKRRNALQTDAELSFEAGKRRSKKLLHATNLSKTRGGRKLFSDVDIFLSPGSRIGIMGANGSGKSTLIHILKGTLEADQGEIFMADGITLTTLDQNRDLPDLSMSLKRALSPHSDTVVFQGSPLHVSAWAKKFLFRQDQLELPVSQLSGGEKARVLLANMMLETSEVLILDEPTNDLDIPTLQVLEDSLQEYAGALVLISHDRFLMDRLCDEILFLPGDGSSHVYADTFQLIKQQSFNQAHLQERALKTPGDNKLRYEKIRVLRKAFDKTERDIEKAEGSKSELEVLLHDPLNATNPEKLAGIAAEIETLDSRLEELMELWETQGSELSDLESV